MCESLPQPGKENSPLFLEKKNPWVFPPKIPFPSKARVWVHVLNDVFFLLYSCQQKKLIHEIRLCKRLVVDGHHPGLNAAKHAHVREKNVWFSFANQSARFRHASLWPGRNWASVYPGGSSCPYLEKKLKRRGHLDLKGLYLVHLGMEALARRAPCRGFRKGPCQLQTFPRIPQTLKAHFFTRICTF